MTPLRVEPSSFRDPSSTIFYQGDKVYRSINKCYRSNYDKLTGSGLYQALIDLKALIPHQVSLTSSIQAESSSLVIEPLKIPFISYPYEWCFSQLKDAALLTLNIQQTALQYGMSLKDASAFNIQFFQGQPIFIDTTSFEEYVEGTPWIAYRQFCQHFLAPLLLMKYKDIRLNQLFKSYIDGIPLDLAAKLLPFKTKCNFTVFSHIVAHAASQKYFSEKQIQTRKYHLSKFQHSAMISGLQSFIQKLVCKNIKSEWGNYYSDTNYIDETMIQKKETVKRFIGQTPQGMLFDIGGNIGIFSRIANDLGRETVCFDIDPEAVEKNYLTNKTMSTEVKSLQLIMDIANPSPSIGWQNEERKSFFERGRPEAVLALALIHHLCISNNLSIEAVAVWFNRISEYCIIEWVPKEDSQVKRLLSNRADIFSRYTIEHFEECFKKYFEIIEMVQLKHSLRKIYLMKRKLR